MDLVIECRTCGHVERATPQEVRNYVATVRRNNAMLEAHRLKPVDMGDPDLTLQRCTNGISCDCGSSDWRVDAIKAASFDGPEEDYLLNPEGSGPTSA